MKVKTVMRYAATGSSTIETTIPLEIVKQLELKAGESLEWDLKDGKILVQVALADALLEKEKVKLK